MSDIDKGLMIGPLGATDRIPANHPLRAIRALLEPVLHPRYAGDTVEEDTASLTALLSTFCVAGLQGSP